MSHLDVRAEVEAMIQRVQQTWTLWLLEQGDAHGQLQARRETLREQLEERFGLLPIEIVRQIEALSELDQLKALLRRVVHIRSLDELQLQVPFAACRSTPAAASNPCAAATTGC